VAGQEELPGGVEVRQVDAGLSGEVAVDTTVAVGDVKSLNVRF
jgi:hypothetical protein